MKYLIETEEGKGVVNMERSPEGLTIARAYRPPRSLVFEAVDELPNEPNLHL